LTFSRDDILDLWGAVPSNFYNPTTPKLYFQLDLGRRAASSWALPHISSFVTPLGMTVTDVIFYLFHHRISDLPRTIAVKLYRMIRIVVRCIIVQNVL